MVLYNPAFMVALRDDPSRRDEVKQARLKNLRSLKIAEDEAQKYVITDNVVPDLPPTYMWFGSDDGLLRPGMEFKEKAESQGATVDLQVTEGVGHGHSNDYEPVFKSTIERIDSFLVASGLLA